MWATAKPLALDCNAKRRTRNVIQFIRSLVEKDTRSSEPATKEEKCYRAN